ncbi:LysR family transcriptional regulator [Variovorax sp. PCZ-1]|uniref:LysR family transcriptional regulator n=1 Tax=Variovorax sp. PCZ-1 TaxID=2835533 RepID=UPI0020BD9914|nr:LysR family transcriptional regulator [Variovorax sp. PCZ-1]
MKSQSVNLDGLDLNLLRVLDVLMQERRVATAAQRLQLSQPAVSNALGRLRKALGDELLTRAPNGMEPTEFAKSLHATLQPALASIGQSLQAKASFDPALSVWQASIAMTDIGEIVFLPPLLSHIAQAAPGLTLETLRDDQAKPNAPVGSITTAMAEGKVDLAVGWLPDVTEGLYQRKLFTQRYVCIARQGHPMLSAKKPKLTLEKFLQAEHIAIRAEGTGHTKADETLQSISQGSESRKVRLRVPNFLSVPQIVSQTDLIATVPEKLAQQCAEAFKLQVLPHPVNMPAFELKMFWHRRVHTDPANQWLRALIVEFFAR